jgi:hypothetical protein
MDMRKQLGLLALFGKHICIMNPVIGLSNGSQGAPHRLDLLEMITVTIPFLFIYLYFLLSRSVKGLVLCNPHVGPCARQLVCRVNCTGKLMQNVELIRGSVCSWVASSRKAL